MEYLVNPISKVEGQGMTQREKEEAVLGLEHLTQAVLQVLGSPNYWEGTFNFEFECL